MKTLLMAAATLTISASALAFDYDNVADQDKGEVFYPVARFYAIDSFEDCVSIDDDLRDVKDWYNQDNIDAGKVYPMVYLTTDEDKAAPPDLDFARIAHDYWGHIKTDMDIQNAEDCGAVSESAIRNGL